MMRRIGLAGMIVGAALALTGPALADKIVVGSYPANPPWEYKTDSGAFEGFEVDVANEVGKRLGMDVEFQDMGFQALFAATASGRIDFAISSISITNDRLKNQSFTQPYYDSDGALVGKDGSQVKALEDLKGKVIGVDTGSTGDMWATQNQTKYGFGDIRRFEGLQPAMLDLAAGRLDGYVSDIPALLYYSKDKPQYKVAQRIPSGERYSIMFAKNSPLAGQVNEQITALKKDGTMASLHEKWFGAKPEAGTSTADVLDMPKPKS